MTNVTQKKKNNLSKISTNCYYIGHLSNDTYIVKFDIVNDDNAFGKCYKVRNKPVAKEHQLLIVAVRKKYSVKLDDEIPVKVTFPVISCDNIICEYSLGKEKHTFCLNKYEEPEYKEFEPKFENEKYEVTVKKNITYGKAKALWYKNIYSDIIFKTLSPGPIIYNPSHSTSTYEILKMDLYLPKGDNIKQRPLIMLIHGGAFLNGDKADKDYVEWSNHFAAMGFVVASINYRLGFDMGFDMLERAGYRALQDANAAMRYLVHNATKYRINTNYIFVGGTSAGAITALNLAFMRNKNRPESTYDLGNIDSILPQYKETFSIKAVANMWGAVHDIDMISNAKTSIISFHGDADVTVPYDYDYPCSEQLKIFNKYLTNKMYGSKKINRKAELIGNRSKLYTYRGGGHSLQVDKDGNLTPYFYFIQDSVTAFFVEELIPAPISIVQDKSDKLCYMINGGNIAQIYWKAENGIIIESNSRQARIAFLPCPGTKRITVSGLYDNGIGFKKEFIIYNNPQPLQIQNNEIDGDFGLYD